MFPLHEQLLKASQPARLEEAERLILGILAGNARDKSDYCHLVLDVVSHTLVDEPRTDMVPGEYSAGFAAELTYEGERVSGFMQAIADQAEVTSALDIGTGPGALFAATTAILHKRAKVTAVEANRRSAACAGKIVGLLGLEGRVIIMQGNAFDLDLPEVELGVTDTFAEALLPGKFNEQGPRISALLATRAAHVLPARARIFARDASDDSLISDMNGWQDSGIVDLTKPPETYTGFFPSSGGGDRNIEIYSGFYDERMRPILERFRADDLTCQILIGNLAVSRAGALIGFSYLPGTGLEEHPARLWEAA